jgi:multidrug efflux pump subunit AcrA (membrane-fusion protein)
VSITTPAVGAAMMGAVLFVSSEADVQKNTLEVKVAIDQPPPALKPEMLVNVTFLAPATSESDVLPSAELRLFVPLELVVRDPSGPFVWLADQSAGVARRTVVQLGQTTADGLVEITDGLQLSSRVIATSPDQLRDGAKVRVVGEVGDEVTSPTQSL